MPCGPCQFVLAGDEIRLNRSRSKQGRLWGFRGQSRRHAGLSVASYDFPTPHQPGADGARNASVGMRTGSSDARTRQATRFDMSMQTPAAACRRLIELGRCRRTG